MSFEEYEVSNLSCASCSAKIEDEISNMEEVDSVSINLVTQKIQIRYNSEQKNALQRLNQIASSIEPGVKITKARSAPNASLLSWPLIGLGMLLAIFELAIGFPQALYPYPMLLSYLLVGGKVIHSALRKLLKARVFDEHFLMTIATLGALYLGEYTEAIAVMFLYEVGQLLEGRSVDKSRRAIQNLMAQKPELAHLLTGNEIIDKKVSQIRIGDLIQVRPGERIPLDGSIEQGSSELDTSSLTGESSPLYVEPGAEVFAGFVNGGGLIHIRVQKEESDSAIARILKLIESAAQRKSNTEKFFTRFARIYTPAVVGAALLLFAIPSLLGYPGAIWLKRALIFLIVSCPCALLISIPLSYYIGIGLAARKGIIFKGALYLDTLRKVQTMVFDKTGTLTSGHLSIDKVLPLEGIDPQEVTETAVICEYASSHPLALAIKKAYPNQYSPALVEAFTEEPGKGIIMRYAGDTLTAGSQVFFRSLGYQIPDLAGENTMIHLAKNELYIGSISFKDELKPGIRDSLYQLRRLGIKKMMLLSGDREAKAGRVAQNLGLDAYKAELLPGGKIAEIETIHSQEEPLIAYVGDGLNDAPVLARADIGIAMGEIGNQASIETADIVLLNDKPEQLVAARRISHNTHAIVVQNICLALGVKSLVMILGAAGLSSLWEAIIADVGVTLLAILNSMRALKIKSAA